MESRMDTVNHMPVPMSERGAEVNLIQEMRDAARLGVSDEDCLMLCAADRLEKLEAVLERIWKTEILSEWEMRQIARKALE